MDPIPFAMLRALHRTDATRAGQFWAAGHAVTYTVPDCACAIAGLDHADFSDGRFADLGRMAERIGSGQAITIPQSMLAGLRLCPGWIGSARTGGTMLGDLGAALALAGLAQAKAGHMAAGRLALAGDGAVTVTSAG